MRGISQATPMILLVAVLTYVSLSPASANRVLVSPTGGEDALTLSTALKLASPRDSLLLRPGYYEGTYQLKQGVSLIGIEGPDSTILDAAGGRYVLQGIGLDSTTVIAGLTLQNGRRDHPNSGGGGIYLLRSSPTIVNNVFQNHLGYFGGGIFVNYECSPVIAFNVFRYNEGHLGGAIAAYGDCSPLIYNNIFHDNLAVSGGAILSFSASAVIVGNTLVCNTAKKNAGGGTIYLDSSPALVLGNIFAHTKEGGAVFCMDNDSPATFRCNLFWKNEGGIANGACPDFGNRDENGDGDPGFIDLEARDLWRFSPPTDSHPCLSRAGASEWDASKVPRVPDQILALRGGWLRPRAQGAARPTN